MTMIPTENIFTEDVDVTVTSDIRTIAERIQEYEIMRQNEIRDMQHTENAQIVRIHQREIRVIERLMREEKAKMDAIFP